MPAGNLMQANDVGECRGTIPHAACVENVRSGHEADQSRASEVGQLVADSVEKSVSGSSGKFLASMLSFVLTDMRGYLKYLNSQQRFSHRLADEN